MWRKSYKDYKENGPWKKEKRETGHGIIGCEMNERFGFGDTEVVHKKKKKAKHRLWTLFKK